MDGNKILYPLSLALAYHANKLFNSTAKIQAGSRGNRYKHLAEARAKAISLSNETFVVTCRPSYMQIVLQFATFSI